MKMYGYILCGMIGGEKHVEKQKVFALAELLVVFILTLSLCNITNITDNFKGGEPLV